MEELAMKAGGALDLYGAWNSGVHLSVMWHDRICVSVLWGFLDAIRDTLAYMEDLGRK